MNKKEWDREFLEALEDNYPNAAITALLVKAVYSQLPEAEEEEE